MQGFCPISVEDYDMLQAFFRRLCSLLLPRYACSYKITLPQPANFLGLIYSRLSESAIKDLLRLNMVGFTENRIKVEMSSGPDYPKMQLIVTEFVPSNREFLSLTFVEKAATGDDHEFAHSYAPPLGVCDTVKQNLEKICLSHMKSIITQSRSLGEIIHGDTSVISWKAFEAVNRYRKHSSGTGGNVRTLDMKPYMRLIAYLSENPAAEGMHALCDALLHGSYHYLHQHIGRRSCHETPRPYIATIHLETHINI